MGLLARWIWSFGNEEAPLWKRVICARYGVDDFKMSWNWQGLSSSSSCFIKAVASLLKPETRSKKVLTYGWRIVLGNGMKASFWKDIRSDSISLKDSFPRIFALSTLKEGSVSNFEFWQGLTWFWHISLRRNLFGWELNHWNCFIAVLNCIEIRQSTTDALAWNFSSNGIYTVRSFCRAMEASRPNESWLDNFSWQDLAGGWAAFSPSNQHNRAWNSLFFAVVWSIWETRNSKVFNNGEATVCLAADSVKLKVAWWFKFYGRGSTDPITFILINIKDRCTDSIVSKQKKVEEWIPPITNGLKFNVDGSVRGKPGPAGIGGVLRDDYGRILCLFSLFVGIRDSNEAEPMAIEKATQLCASNPSMMGRDITIVSDSKVAVSWINKAGFGNINHVDTVYSVRHYLASLGGTVVSFASRASNSFADNLAKLGSSIAGGLHPLGRYLIPWFSVEDILCRSCGHERFLVCLLFFVGWFV
ncbi:hypothetical protein Dsin_007295 [Dipteronia sinensis]|uniref:RNase H type-1 domain-containing protein n=1 Tax=Dipteronia sinensis TaxID=43782 RepID=A0AAE0B0U8_9ROSI|nr:hypothetical protein Dsin_007295 [Dipteronia sinensis]